MTDETREQIKRDASKFLMHPESEYFKQGATHQHPISFEQGRKEERKQVINEVLRELANYKDLFEYKDDYTEVVKQIVKLRNPNP